VSSALNQKGNHAVWQVHLSSESDTVSREHKDQLHCNKNNKFSSLVWKPTGHKGNDYCQWNYSSISFNNNKKTTNTTTKIRHNKQRNEKGTYRSDTYTETPRTEDSIKKKKGLTKNASFTQSLLGHSFPSYWAGKHYKQRCFKCNIGPVLLCFAAINSPVRFWKPPLIACGYKIWTGLLRV
jgi:hypothetical protein